MDEPVQTSALDPASRLVDGTGRPARRKVETTCPRCRAGEERRVPSGGFGLPHEVCGVCGYEFPTEE